MREDVAISDGLIGTTIQDRYKVISRIGEGGMGVVYEVEHVLIGRRFALKTLSPLLAQDREVIARFHREARAAATIGDKHIIELSDMGHLPNGSSYIVLELLRGRDLTDELERSGPMPVSRAIKIATQCCRALGKAHEKGIVHRDIKPDNIYLDSRQESPDFVKILDFGISKIREAAVGLESGLKTKTGATIGTPYYMSPEQACGETVDQRTDIYAMGVVLFQMLMGRVPFIAQTFPMLIVKIMHEPPPSLIELRSDIPIELVARNDRSVIGYPRKWGSLSSRSGSPRDSRFIDDEGDLKSGVTFTDRFLDYLEYDNWRLGF